MYSFVAKLRNDLIKTPVLLCQLLPNQRIGDLIEWIYKNRSNHLEFAAEIVIRLPVHWQVRREEMENLKFPLTPSQNSALSEVAKSLSSNSDDFKRVLTKPVTIIGTYAHEVWISKNINKNISINSRLSTSDEVIAAAVSELKNCEIDSIVNDSNALLPTLEGGAYKTPSSKYTRSFLRVGNIQKSQYILDAFFSGSYHSQRIAKQ